MRKKKTHKGVTIVIRKKRTGHLVDFAVPADHSENQWILLERWKWQGKWYTKMIVIPVVAGVLGTVLKGLERRPGKSKTRGRLEKVKVD